ncbi:MAG: acetylornithine deacetylase [Thermomicrobiales bacterium]|nr:acetylornithine deacetylase [Thermomicrobiales bacterium]
MSDPFTARLAEVATDVLPGQVQLLRDLIACRAVSTQLPDEEFVSESERAIDLIERALAPLQFVTQRWRTAGGFPVLCARRDVPSRASTVGFNGHLDVVPIEDPAKWRHDPWGGAQVESRLYGRGACDAKGAVVAMTGALQLLAAAGVEPVTHLLLHIVTDEEVAGDCTDECLERGWPDAVIVGEPSALDVWIAEPGLEHVRVEIEGLATHALNRWRALSDAPGSEAGGVNAIDKALIVASTVRDLERTWTTEQRYDLLPPGFNTINLGAIVGGKSSGPGEINAASGPGSVPDGCALEYNIWYYPHQSLPCLRAEFEERVLATCASDWWLSSHPPRFIWALRGLTNPPAETDRAHPLAETMLSSARRVNASAEATSMQGASLLPWYTRRGIPGVIFGPGNVAQAHGVDEFIDLDSLRETTIALALALADARMKEVPRLVQA